MIRHSLLLTTALVLVSTVSLTNMRFSMQLNEYFSSSKTKDEPAFSARRRTTSYVSPAAAADRNEPVTVVSRPNKYLKYGATAGWANQLLSLEHALWLADATQRTLVLPPMLPHFSKIQGSYRGSSIDAEYAKVKKYIPLTKLLEFEWSGLVVVDWNVFVHNQATSNLTATELSYKYKCSNTKWTRDLTAIPRENLTMRIHTCKDHKGLKGVHNVTYRDMVTTLQQYDDFDVLNFKFIFPWSGFDTAHQRPIFNLTYTEPIRSTARSIRDLWGNEPYSSIHIRASDGPYFELFKANATAVIRGALKMVGAQMEQYHREKQQLRNVTLLVITDVGNMRNHPSWANESAAFARRLVDEQGISLSYVFSSDYEARVKTLQTNLQAPPVSICVDMQLAACADIGFGYFKTTSTFLKRILAMRRQPPVC